MPASPRRNIGGCQYNGNQVYRTNRDLVADLDLDFFQSPDGLMVLLQKISDREFDDAETIIEMIKRLHIPNYEVARPHLDSAIADGIFEPNTKPGYPHQDQLLTVRSWAGV